VFSAFPLWDTHPLLLPTAVVGVALYEGYVSGGLFGLAAGILTDATLNEPAMVFTVLLPLIGLAAGYLSETVLVKSIQSYVILCIGALILCAFVQIFPLAVYSGVPVSELARCAMYQSLYSMFFVLPNYFISRMLGGVLT